ncbi:OmpP1/FadL family transporter [Oceanicoccus sagamiensis]|uniref:Aromatic hydrocarbon degradation protein n=1 Tax=Oceanicoccus sagamiensis TaxID=716816 RepID=A0A1X9NIU1_9GAMM|nr:outer membrane protein transport protein [Oceanicoccus sagamiensis]ARN75755.1 hypothetical protein BST96_17565 [Oceanicoccus sagamiensis]
MLKLAKAGAIVPLIILSEAASAGGLWLNEYGTPAMGRARAGAAAGVDDASAVLHNPASITRLEKRQSMATGGIIYNRTDFDVKRGSIANGDKAGSDAGGVLPTGSGFYVEPNFNDKWSWGLSAGGLAGTGLDYSSDWVGRYQAERVELLTLAFAGTLAYEVSDKLSIGISPQIVYGALEVDIAVPDLVTSQPDSSAEIDGDDMVLGYMLGVMYTISDDTRLGLTYQSEWDFEFDGDLNRAPGANPSAVSIETELPLAAFVRLALTHRLNDTIGLHATVGWDDWSTLDKVNLSTDNLGASIAANWDDTYHYAVGIDYRVSPEWVLSTGLAYDTNPVSLDDRNAQLPVDRQMRYAFGAQYNQDKPFSMGGQLVYADLGKAGLNGVGDRTGPGLGFEGEFTTNEAFFLSINAKWILE